MKLNIIASMVVMLGFSFANAGAFRTCSQTEILKMMTDDSVSTRQIPVGTSIYEETLNFPSLKEICATPNGKFFFLKIGLDGGGSIDLVLNSNIGGIKKN